MRRNTIRPGKERKNDRCNYNITYRVYIWWNIS